MNELELAVAAYGVGNRVETVSDNAVNAFNPCFHQPVYQFVSNSVRHVYLLLLLQLKGFNFPIAYPRAGAGGHPQDWSSRNQVRTAGLRAPCPVSRSSKL